MGLQWRSSSGGGILLALTVLILLGTGRYFANDAVFVGMPAPVAAPLVVALGVLTIVSGMVLIDRLVRYFYWDGYLRRKRKRDTPALIEDLFTIALVVLGASFGLFFEAGVSFTGLLTASGATAIVLGIALQTVIQDLASGLSINLDGSYAIGDWLTIYSDQFPDAVYGRVQGITWRTTLLRLDDGRGLIIPNRLVTSNPVLNHSRPPAPKRLTIEIPVDNRFPADRAMNILLGEAFRAVRQPPLSREPSPDILISKFDSDSTYFLVRFYADPALVDPETARSTMAEALHRSMLRHSLPMPVTNIEMVPSPGSFEFDAKEARDAIGRVPIFKETLDAEQLDALVAASPVRVLPRGTAFIRQGDAGMSMFIILEGAARVSLAAADGEVRDVAVLAGGDIVGEMSLLTGSPRTATVTSLTSARVLEVTKDAVETLLKTSPGLLGHFSSVLAARQVALTEIANREQRQKAVEKDMLDRMREFFSRVFR